MDVGYIEKPFNGTLRYANMELWREVRRRVLTGELTKRAARKIYNLHWDTLTKILENEEPPGYRKQKEREKPVLGQSCSAQDLRILPNPTKVVLRVFAKRA